MSDPYVLDIPKRNKNRRMGKTTSKPYSHPERLLDMYRFMEEYYKKNRVQVSVAELVENGFGGSSSVTRFYLDHMIRFGMVERQIITRADGRKYSPARGIRLLPLSQASQVVQNLLAAEKVTEQNEDLRRKKP